MAPAVAGPGLFGVGSPAVAGTGSDRLAKPACCSPFIGNSGCTDSAFRISFRIPTPNGRGGYHVRNAPRNPSPRAPRRLHPAEKSTIYRTATQTMPGRRRTGRPGSRPIARYAREDPTAVCPAAAMRLARATAAHAITVRPSGDVSKPSTRARGSAGKGARGSIGVDLRLERRPRPYSVPVCVGPAVVVA